ncbi:MAG: ChaN family lipoprotein [Gallionella sp.]
MGLPVPVADSKLKTEWVDVSSAWRLQMLLDKLQDKRALFIGEIHDIPEHHENQLRVIQALYENNQDIAIGVEYFQQPFQSVINDYIAGYIDEKEMLVRSEYFKRWKIDYRMVQPILKFAREKRIPVLALNISEEIHHKVFEDGLKSLTPRERKLVPSDLQPISSDYRNRLSTIFNSHPEGTKFETFVEGQMLWDESMADVSANYLKEHPHTKLVVLAGLGHMMFGDGIPTALDRRLGGRFSAIAINGDQIANYPGVADYIVAAKSDRQLPKPGKLGITIDDSSESVVITQLLADGAARDSGIELGDRIITLEGLNISSFADIKAVMFDKLPGDVVHLTLRRNHLLADKGVVKLTVPLR